MKKEYKRSFLLNKEQFNKILNGETSYLTIDTLQGYLYPFNRLFEFTVNFNQFNNDKSNNFCNFSISVMNPDDPYERSLITFNLTIERACSLFNECEYYLKKTKYILSSNSTQKELIKINDKYILNIFFKDKNEMMNYIPNFEFHEEVTLNKEYDEFNFAKVNIDGITENSESDLSELNIFIKDEISREFDSDELSANFVTRTF